ncbi:MAG: class I SAM-dependent methyltransferase [Verrucomicrobiota bacterium]
MKPNEIKEAFLRGENITELLRRASNSKQNTEEIIETAYDLQTGSYIKALESPEMFQHKLDYGNAIAAKISSLTQANSILEPGVGEGTTLSFVIQSFDKQPEHIHGFDISWSRIAHCRSWLSNQNCPGTHLSTASILEAPYMNDSFDVVYTSHTIEPNGGNEKKIIEELYRVASRFLILLEPAYELANNEARARMRRLGYCSGLVDHAESLGMSVIKHEIFPYIANPLNPTAITVIAKNPNAPTAIPKLACPRYRNLLDDFGDSLYSDGSLRAYPKIQKIPCLRSQDGVITSTYVKSLESE